MAPVDDQFLRILVASDIHLGYGEKMAERSMDSFNSFDELLGIGKERNVDLCILGGDLFHENKPTRSAQINCTQILTKHVFGNDPIYLEYASNPEVDFKHCNTKAVNYEDTNVNISLPIFSIHGNHDDPSGLGGHSCMDILHESKLVNYFGKIDSYKEIKLSPILLKKNGVKLAIYGLSSLKDERLHRLFREKKVIFETPKDVDDWFNILVLHQNRAKRGPTNYIPESFIPSFFNLVIWGHEHDCRIEPEHSTCGKEFYICQPGSPVATSLCDGEAIQKKVGIVSIGVQGEFKLEPVALQTVRPFIFVSKCLTEFKRLNLDDKDEKKMQAAIEKELALEVDDMIEQAQAQLTGHPKQGELPLIRLRIEYSDERHQLNPVRFGNNYMGRVANPAHLLHYKKRTFTERQVKDELTGKIEMKHLPGIGSRSTEDYINEYFDNPETKAKLNILSVQALNSGVSSYINKSDNDALAYVIRNQLRRRQEKLLNEEDFDDDDDFETAFARLKGSVNEEEEAEIAKAELNREDRKIVPVPETVATTEDMDFNVETDDEDKPVIKPTRGRGRGARGAAAKTTARASASSRRNVNVIPDSDEEISNEEDTPSSSVERTLSSTRTSISSSRRGAASTVSAAKTTTRGGARGRGSRGGARGARGAAGGQTSILAAFASQTQRSTATQGLNSTRSTQRNKKQQFSSSDEEFK